MDLFETVDKRKEYNGMDGINRAKNNDGGAFFGVGDSVFSAAGFCGQEAVRTAQYETQPRYAAA